METDVEAQDHRRDSYPSLYDIHEWKLRGLCNGQSELFDLEEEDKFGEPGARKRNVERVKVAKDICHSCPVFQQCWDDASKHVKTVNGVVRAGAKLGNGFASKRRKALDHSMQEHQKLVRLRG